MIELEIRNDLLTKINRSSWRDWKALLRCQIIIKAHAGESLEIEALEIIQWFFDTKDTAPE